MIYIIYYFLCRRTHTLDKIHKNVSKLNKNRKTNVKQGFSEPQAALLEQWFQQDGYVDRKILKSSNNISSPKTNPKSVEISLKHAANKKLTESKSSYNHCRKIVFASKTNGVGKKIFQSNKILEPSHVNKVSVTNTESVTLAGAFSHIDVPTSGHAGATTSHETDETRNVILVERDTSRGYSTGASHTATSQEKEQLTLDLKGDDEQPINPMTLFAFLEAQGTSLIPILESSMMLQESVQDVQITSTLKPSQNKIDVQKSGEMVQTTAKQTAKITSDKQVLLLKATKKGKKRTSNLLQSSTPASSRATLQRQETESGRAFDVHSKCPHNHIKISSHNECKSIHQIDLEPDVICLGETVTAPPVNCQLTSASTSQNHVTETERGDHELLTLTSDCGSATSTPARDEQQNVQPKPKRTRKKYSVEEQKLLCEAFLQSPHPCTAKMQELATQLNNVSGKQVNRWFKNRRSNASGKKQGQQRSFTSPELHDTLQETFEKNACPSEAEIDKLMASLSDMARARLYAALTKKHTITAESAEHDDITMTQQTKAEAPRPVTDYAILHDVFAKTKHPSSKSCRVLADKLRLNVGEVTFWFAAERARAAINEPGDLTQEQKDEMERHYAEFGRITSVSMESLAERLSLTYDRVKHWFLTNKKLSLNPA